MLNCTTGTMDSSNFSKWTPLTGVYIATATLVCAIAIIKDLVDGLISKQYWIPSAYTSLNSISLTILGAATKLSMDLSTAMPRHVDQLAKLGTSALMSIALASIHPSLGKLESSELQSNTVSLSILVISSMVSLCIQLRTGVIYTFKTAHIIMITMMGLLLFQCILSNAILPWFKLFYQTNYQEQDQLARKGWIDVEDNKRLQTEKLKQYLKRFSIIAHSCCPHFLLSRSFLGTLPTIWGLVAAIAFFVTQTTFITHGDNFWASTSGSSISTYSWSILLIFITQTIALGVGTIVLCTRGCYITMVYLKGMDSPIWKGNNFRMNDAVAIIMIQAFSAYIKYSYHKSLIYKLMDLHSIFHLLLSFILVGISVAVSYTVDFSWKYMVSFCSFIKRRCTTCKLPCSPSATTRSNNLATEVEELSGQYFALPGLEKEGSVKWIMKSIVYVTQKDMSAKERKTEHLEELLGQYLSPNFRGVVSFDSEEVAPLDDSQESPPNCWSLPVMTLTRIAIALPNVDRDLIVRLTKGVSEGLVLVKLIEDMFNNQPRLNPVRSAAYRQWRRRFKIPASQKKSPKEILKSKATSAKKYFHKNAHHDIEDKVEAHSKYRLCETILLEHRNEDEPTQDDSGRIFEKLCSTVADILGACLTNLKQYILTECSNCLLIEKRREAASSILRFFGDTEKIMEIIDTREIPEMNWEKMVFIDNWREYYQYQMQLP